MPPGDRLSRAGRQAAFAALLFFSPWGIPAVRAECMTLTTTAPCPVAHQILAQTSTGPGINLLVLGDGFLEADLEAYQCAVDRIVARLVATPPYSTYACALNVYRMDLVTSRATGGIPVNSACTVSCAEKASPPYGVWACDPGPTIPATSSPGDTLLSRRDCAVVDLGTSLCANLTSCWLIYPSAAGLENVATLSTCLADIDAVLILVNSGAYAGGFFPGGSPPAATATLYEIGAATEGNLATHELGHALFGLLDEYQTDCDTCEFRAARNIVPGDALRLGLDFFAWRDDCTSQPCSQTCTYTGACGASCPADEGGQACCTPTMETHPLATKVGLFEGGWYRNCGYYRAQDNCKMREIAQPFCTGCKAVARRQLAARSIAACE